MTCELTSHMQRYENNWTQSGEKIIICILSLAVSSAEILDHDAAEIKRNYSCICMRSRAYL